MPNNITSQVRIGGSKEAIAKLIKESKLIQDGDVEKNEFDFNAVVKTPSNIYQGNLGQEERRIHGKNNWYDWNTENWGTKWNAYDVHYTDGGDNFIVIQIDTAWDTPRQIWEALREQGFTVDGFCYGEMEGYEEIGENAWDYFSAYQNVEVEYNG